MGASQSRAQSRFRYLLAAAAGAVAFAIAGPIAEARAEPPPSFPSPLDVPPLEAVVVVPEFGEFRIRFTRDETPNHVAHFLTLAAQGFYDGLEIHRVIPGYLIQTGNPSTREGASPDSTGTGPAYRLPPEPTERHHTAGTVSMAWVDDRAGTAGSQWFVTLADIPDLDGRATPIGWVSEGFEVVEGIAQVTTHRDRRPRHRVLVETIRLERENPADTTGDGTEAPGVEDSAEVPAGGVTP